MTRPTQTETSDRVKEHDSAGYWFPYCTGHYRLDWCGAKIEELKATEEYKDVRFRIADVEEDMVRVTDDGPMYGFWRKQQYGQIQLWRDAPEEL